jgi:hypothetical protein
MRKIILIITYLTIYCQISAQILPDPCKLKIGTNLSGISDYGTEIPVVDMMKICREWYTKDVGNPNDPFDTQASDSMTYRPDGYPTHIPQTVANRPYQQKSATIWASTNAWKLGDYVVLFDGVGALSFGGGMSNLVQVTPNKYTFTFAANPDNFLELVIDSSLISNPVRNIRIVHVDYETTYLTQPFNPIWLNKLSVFKSVRFMDWGHTNNWGQVDQWSWDSTILFDWNDRAKLDYYTWTGNKGIPYEMMIKLMNDYDLDGWICVPHRASNDYMDQMATLFRDNVETDRKLVVEYSNEIWNWMFGQTNWLYQYGCVATGQSWPEGIVPYIQNCLNRWTTVYGSDVNRIKRAVGLQTGWLDVSQRIVFNLTPGSFDVVSPTYYFGLSETADSTLDALGASATATDIAYWARQTREVNEKVWINGIKTTIADSLNVPMYFYEGGQHLTPTPFGEEPTYANALLEVQRHPEMYALYNEWYDYLRTLQSGSEPLTLMNFAFVSGRSARYGSWGILESMAQDTTLVPAPKYQSTIENMAGTGCFTLSIVDDNHLYNLIKVYPNPFCDFLIIRNESNEKLFAELVDINGRTINSFKLEGAESKIQLSNVPDGIYFLKIHSTNGKSQTYKLIKQ